MVLRCRPWISWLGCVGNRQTTDSTDTMISSIKPLDVYRFPIRCFHLLLTCFLIFSSKHSLRALIRAECFPWVPTCRCKSLSAFFANNNSRYKCPFPFVSLLCKGCLMPTFTATITAIAVQRIEKLTTHWTDSGWLNVLAQRFLLRFLLLLNRSITLRLRCACAGAKPISIWVIRMTRFSTVFTKVFTTNFITIFPGGTG